MPSGSLRVHSGGVRGAAGSERSGESVRLTPAAGAVRGADVGRLSFGSRVKSDAAGCGLLLLVGEGQSIGGGRLCWELRGSVMAGPIGDVSGLVFAPAPGPMVNVC